MFIETVADPNVAFVVRNAVTSVSSFLNFLTLRLTIADAEALLVIFSNIMLSIANVRVLTLDETILDRAANVSNTKICTEAGKSSKLHSATFQVTVSCTII